ncbi:glutathione S-transferase family protein [Sphingorhabdus sp. Alg239-R122]|uniref:glutathione S-transferase family protein n=1 Tax=Sphingorhabdus sp. Alg239-R122 TaxID=2305989 RepID=UPI0013DD4719|nr:glutathione S-transferase family protein [Sphingorhabdus sp. Alg239-R122]
MSGTIQFYTNPMSRGQIARWALHEAGADYDQHIIAYEDMKSPDYLAVNPMGKVPAIVHDGKIVTECAAICAYLADVFPGSNLTPAADERADYYRWMFYGAGPVEAAIINNSLGFHTDEEKSRMAGYGTYDQMVDVLDGMLGERQYICGDRFTAADIYMGSQVIWGTQFKTLPERDNFTTYAARLSERDAYKAAKTIDMELMPAQE